MSNPINGFGSRGTTMAVVCVAAVSGALAAMYGVGRDTKKKEGGASAYKDGGGLSAGGSDVRMTSSDVAAAVSVPKPGKDRLSASK